MCHVIANFYDGLSFANVVLSLNTKINLRKIIFNYTSHFSPPIFPKYYSFIVCILWLCLITGKEACIPCVGDVLAVLSDLLEHEDQEVC